MSESASCVDLNDVPVMMMDVMEWAWAAVRSWGMDLNEWCARLAPMSMSGDLDGGGRDDEVVDDDDDDDFDNDDDDDEEDEDGDDNV